MHYLARFAITPALAAFLSTSGILAAAEEVFSGPPLLSEKPVLPVRPTANNNGVQAAAEKNAAVTGEPDTAQTADAGRRYAPFRDRRRFPGKDRSRQESASRENRPALVETADAAGERQFPPYPPQRASAGYENGMNSEAGADAFPAPPQAVEPPTPEAVELYRVKLEQRLLERYNNLPAHAGKVYQVRVVASKPFEVSLDGRFILAEFDQLVFDIWGKRIPALEQEYFVVTFGAGGVQQVRSDPSIRIGLDMEKSYSERAPLAADPFRHVEDYDAFKDEPKAKMPGWWRPDFPELR